jgi:hypothetical protein
MVAGMCVTITGQAEKFTVSAGCVKALDLHIIQQHALCF